MGPCIASKSKRPKSPTFSSRAMAFSYLLQLNGWKHRLEFFLQTFSVHRSLSFRRLRVRNEGNLEARGPSPACGPGRRSRSRPARRSTTGNGAGPMPGLSTLGVVALERGAEQLRHHAAQARRPPACRGRRGVSSEFSSAGRLTTRMRRLSTTSRMSMSPALDLEDVAEADRELGERRGEVEQREAVLLARLLALLLVERHGRGRSPAARRDRL